MSKNKSQNFSSSKSIVFLYHNNMAPRKPVENLGVLCLKILVEITLDAIKYDRERSITYLKRYFEKLPRILSDAFLLSILEVTSVRSFLKWITFGVFDYRCSRFDSRLISPRFHEVLFEKLENVLYLSLNDVQINERTLKNLIKRCPNLRSLVIPNLATDEVLMEVTNLKKLELLDISMNAILSTTGLGYLSNESLQVLSIGTPLTYSIANYEGYDTLVDILLQLPNLTEIRTYEYTGRALLELKKPYVSKLKVISDYDTSLGQLDAIISVCPRLEELFLEDPENEVFERLGELSELKKLKVNKFCEKPVTLKIKALTLQTLEAKQLRIDISNVCLTLENFIARSCFIFKSIDKDTCFRNLKVIEFIDCDVNKDIVLPLLEYGDMLQRLAVSNDIGLTDSDIRTLCQKKKLKNLEELWLSLAKNLSSDSVVLIMNHCDKLRVLGTLNGWNIEKVEVNYLRCVIYFTNANLNLLHFSCF